MKPARMLVCLSTANLTYRIARVAKPIRVAVASLLLDRGMPIPMGRTMLVVAHREGGAQTATSDLPDLGLDLELSVTRCCFPRPWGWSSQGLGPLA